MMNHQSWSEDLDFVVDNIRTYHPNPYYRIAQRDFEALVAATNWIVAYLLAE